MAKLVRAFHLFGTSKVFVRSLIIYGCQFKTNDDEVKLSSIERTYKLLDGTYRQEESNIDYAIFSRGGTFHLHDLFLSESFGITVTMLGGKGQFETFDLDSHINRHRLLQFRTTSGEEVLLASHLEASPIK